MRNTFHRGGLEQAQTIKSVPAPVHSGGQSAFSVSVWDGDGNWLLIFDNLVEISVASLSAGQLSGLALKGKLRATSSS